MIIIAMRYFGMADMHDIDRLTFRDFRLRMKAYSLRQLDKERDLAFLAWQMREVNATKQSGKNKRKYVYTRFDKFFEHEKYEARIKGEEKPSNGMVERYKQYMRNKANV